MLADRQFNLRLSPQEKKMLAVVAQSFERSKAATVKIFIRRTYQAIKAQERAAKQANVSH